VRAQLSQGHGREEPVVEIVSERGEAMRLELVLDSMGCAAYHYLKSYILKLRLPNRIQKFGDKLFLKLGKC